ncbi:MAG: hypothetical protein ACRD5L_05560, partial [Bryobacteraceae bacterium]
VRALFREKKPHTVFHFAGYVGGILAGDTVARVSVSYGWQGAFLALAGVAVLSALAGALFLRQQGKIAEKIA